MAKPYIKGPLVARYVMGASVPRHVSAGAARPEQSTKPVPCMLVLLVAQQHGRPQ